MAMKSNQRTELALTRKEESYWERKGELEAKMKKWEQFRRNKQAFVESYIKMKKTQKAMQMWVFMLLFTKFMKHIKREHLKQVFVHRLYIQKVRISKRLKKGVLNLLKWQGHTREERQRKQSRLCLTTWGQFIHDEKEIRAKSVFFEFLSHRAARHDMLSKTIAVSKYLKRIRDRFIFQLVRNWGKFSKLVLLFEKELDRVRLELVQAAATDPKNKKAQERLELLEKLDSDTLRYILTKYFQRCKFNYCLAYFQWRSQQEDASEKECYVLFTQRKNNYLKKL